MERRAKSGVRFGVSGGGEGGEGGRVSHNRDK